MRSESVLRVGLGICTLIVLSVGATADELKAQDMDSPLALGQAALAEGDPEAARLAFREAIRTSSAQGDSGGEAMAWKELGTALYQLERYEEAEQAQRSGLTLARRLEDLGLQARLANNLGLSLQARGQAGEAEQQFRESLELARSAGAGEVELIALGNLAGSALQAGELDTAIALLRRSLAGARRIDRLDLVAATHVSLAQVATARDDSARAILHYRSAIEGFQQLEDGVAQVKVLPGLGMAFLQEGIMSLAHDAFEEALRLSRLENMAEDELLILHSMYLAARKHALEWPTAESLEAQIEIGTELLPVAGSRDRGLVEQTTRQLAEARTLLAQLTDPEVLEPRATAGNDPLAVAPHRGDTQALRKLAHSLADLGDIAGALELTYMSLKLARSEADHPEQARALEVLGSLYLAVGLPKRAENVFQELRVLADQDERLRAWSDHWVSQAKLLQGDESGLQAKFRQSLTAARQLDDPELLALSHHGLAILAVIAGDYPQAIEHWNRQLTHIRAQEPSRAAPSTRQMLTSVLEEAELEGLDPQQLDTLLQSDPAVAALIQSHFGLDEQQADTRAEWARVGALQEALILQNLAWAHASTGESATALEHLDKAQELVAVHGATGDRAAVHDILGHVHYRAAQLASAESDRMTSLTKAETHLKQAFAAYDELWSQLGDADAYKVSTQDIYSVPYELLQRVLVEQGKEVEALEVAELARARALAEAVARRPSIKWTTEHAQLDPTRAPTFDEITALAQTSETTFVIYSVLHDPTTLFLEDHLSDQRERQEDKLLIWVVSGQANVALEQVDLSKLRRPLSQLITQSRWSLGVRGRGSVLIDKAPSPEAALAEMAELLITPIADHLTRSGNERVVLVPQGALFLVPFAALPGPTGKPLVDNWTLTTVPSIGVLTTLQNELSDDWSAGDVLIVGDPELSSAYADLQQLDHAQREAEAAADLFGAQPLIRDQATKGAVAQSMPGKRLIHLACHALLEPRELESRQELFWDGRFRDPRDLPGGLILASSDHGIDGLLTASEISDLELEAELVVLSACDTGKGRITGDGVLGLARSFVVAGAGAVVVSLWQVDDASTSFLMQSFYRNLAETRDIAGALRHAMIETRIEYPDPRQWSGFVVAGAAR